MFVASTTNAARRPIGSPATKPGGMASNIGAD
jgi:hypothetical protein